MVLWFPCAIDMPHSLGKQYSVCVTLRSHDGWKERSLSLFSCSIRFWSSSSLFDTAILKGRNGGHTVATGNAVMIRLFAGINHKGNPAERPKQEKYKDDCDKCRHGRNGPYTGAGALTTKGTRLHHDWDPQKLGCKLLLSLLLLLRWRNVIDEGLLSGAGSLLLFFHHWWCRWSDGCRACIRCRCCCCCCWIHWSCYRNASIFHGVHIVIVVVCFRRLFLSKEAHRPSTRE